MEVLNDPAELNDVLDSIFMSHSQHQLEHPNNDYRVILDNGATSSLIRNENLLCNIRDARTITTIRGINGSDAGIVVDKVGDFLSFGEVYYCPQATANLVSMSKIRDNHQVEYSHSANLFIVRNEKDSYKFELVKGLYICDFTPHEEAYAQSYEKKENVKATLVKMIKKRLGYISDQALVKCIADSSIRGMPIDLLDVKEATKTNGPSIDRLKGTARSPAPNFPQKVHLPRVTPKDQYLEMDLMYCESDAFLIGVSVPLDLTMANFICKENNGIQIIHKTFSTREGSTFSVLLSWFQHREDTMRLGRGLQTDGK